MYEVRGTILFCRRDRLDLSHRKRLTRRTNPVFFFIIMRVILNENYVDLTQSFSL